MTKKIVFGYWKDSVPRRFWMGREASLKNIRRWGLTIGRHFLSIEIHGWGPTP